MLIAFDSNIFPISYKVITITPSITLFTKHAPITEMVINAFSSNTPFRICINAFFIVLLNNIIIDTIISTICILVLKFNLVPKKYISIPIIILAIWKLSLLSFFLLLSSISTTLTSGSNALTISIISFFGLFLFVLNDKVEKFTVTSS